MPKSFYGWHSRWLLRTYSHAENSQGEFSAWIAKKVLRFLCMISAGKAGMIGNVQETLSMILEKEMERVEND